MILNGCIYIIYLTSPPPLFYFQIFTAINNSSLRILHKCLCAHDLLFYQGTFLQEFLGHKQYSSGLHTHLQTALQKVCAASTLSIYLFLVLELKHRIIHFSFLPVGFFLMCLSLSYISLITSYYCYMFIGWLCFVFFIVG